VPFDPAVERAAWDGALVPRGRFLRAVENLAGEVLVVGSAEGPGTDAVEVEG
jgi:hypothetical protein